MYTVHYLCHDVFFMLWCITYVMIWFLCCIMYVMTYFLCCDVLHMLWHIAWVVTYFLCYDVLHVSWFILYVMIWYMSWYILYVQVCFVLYSVRIHDTLGQYNEWWVVKRVCGSFMSPPAPISIASNTLHTMHSPVGWAPRARRLASHLLCSACMRTTLYTYYPVGDALMVATRASVSCHVWQCHVWCICHI